MIEIYQGDQFPLTFSIEGEDGEYITESDITEMLFTIGKTILKKYSDGDITYDDSSKQFTVNLTIEDTTGLLIKCYDCQLRVFFDDDLVLSFNCGQMLVNKCLGLGDDNG